MSLVILKSGIAICASLHFNHNNFSRLLISVLCQQIPKTSIYYSLKCVHDGNHFNLEGWDFKKALTIDKLPLISMR
jgi:hypothetical protein